MTFNQIINIWTDYLPLNVTIWFLLFSILFYFAKTPIHMAIRSFCKILHDGLIQMSESVISTVEKLKDRNKEVLLSTGMEAIEKQIEREFIRVNVVVERDLSGFPVLKRQLLEQIAKIEEDYHESSNIPPAPPEWIESVESLAKLPNETAGNKAIANILKEIHKASANQHKSTMEEYRKAVAEHHTGLKKLMPYWRKLTNTLDVVGRTISGLQERAVKIDKKMDEYEEILSKTDKAERLLSSSSMTQFFISGFVLAIAIAGALINFHLIKMPMQEMVGAGSYIGNFRISEIAALVIILVEVAMGLYLMESLRFTNLFPVIGQMDDKMRYKMIWITFSLLLILAGIESSLALMRDQLLVQSQNMKATINDIAPVGDPSPLITIGQMVLGFILPFILTFVAIPLESFIHSSRTVFGFLLVIVFRFLSFTLNLSGKIILNCGEFFISIYDIMIFPLLWFEDMLLKKILINRADNKSASPQSENKLVEEVVNEEEIINEESTK